MSLQALPFRGTEDCLLAFLAPGFFAKHVQAVLLTERLHGETCEVRHHVEGGAVWRRQGYPSQQLATPHPKL
jgi:hypothetical protein